MRKEIPPIRREDIECLNYRFSTASLTEGESRLHLFKLEYQDPQCEGLDCNHGCYKAVIPSCRNELDNSDMFMLNVEFTTPVNFVCKKCVDASGISSKLFVRKSSAKTILNDSAVGDVIVCEKSLRGNVLQKFKGTERQVQVYT